MDRRARRQTASSRSNSTVSDSSFQDKSDSSVPKGASKKKRTQQTVSTPLHKEIPSQSQFVPRSTQRTEEMDRGHNDMDGASANSTRVLSPDSLDSCTLRLFQRISRESMQRDYQRGSYVKTLC